MIVAHTIKGKGCSYDFQVEWHGAAPKPEEVERALAELELITQRKMMKKQATRMLMDRPWLRLGIYMKI